MTETLLDRHRPSPSARATEAEYPIEKYYGGDYSCIMSSYTTITSKGQITIPAEARKALGLRPGQKVSVRVEGDRLVIDPPRDIEWLRERIRAERTSDPSVIPHAGDGWAARAEDYRVQR